MGQVDDSFDRPPGGVVAAAGFSAFVRVACALLAVLAGGACGGEREPRHVIVLSFDTARADHFGFMGNRRVQTPRLDALAEESIVLEQLTTVVPETLSAHTTLLTGLYPHHHGVARNAYRVNAENRMLPEMLAEHDFHSAGFVSAFVLDDRFEFAQGFDHYDQNFDQLIPSGVLDYVQRSATSTTDAAIAYLRERGTPERLFLFVHYFDPHQPFVAPDRFAEMYDVDPDVSLPSLQDLAAQVASGTGDGDAVLSQYIRLYGAQITYLDEQVGRLIDFLREEILDDAILVIVSDHGENFAEHGARLYFQHAALVFQTTSHCVGLLRLPGGARGGARISAPASNVDITPTVLSLLGIPVPDGLDGRPLALRAGESTGAPRPVFTQASGPIYSNDGALPWANANKARSIREGRFKLIQDPILRRELLFDVEADAAEKHDLLASPTPETAARAKALRERLQAWVGSADPLPSEFVEMNKDDTIKKLRALGYLE